MVLAEPLRVSPLIKVFEERWFFLTTTWTFSDWQVGRSPGRHLVGKQEVARQQGHWGWGKCLCYQKFLWWALYTTVFWIPREVNLCPDINRKTNKQKTVFYFCLSAPCLRRKDAAHLGRREGRCCRQGQQRKHDLPGQRHWHSHPRWLLSEHFNDFISL